MGRQELVTPETKRAVEQAFRAHDQPALDKYRRFLAPILNATIVSAQADPARTRVLRGYLNSAYSYACRSAWPSQRQKGDMLSCYGR